MFTFPPRPFPYRRSWRITLGISVQLEANFIRSQRVFCTKYTIERLEGRHTVRLVAYQATNYSQWTSREYIDHRETNQSKLTKYDESSEGPKFGGTFLLMTLPTNGLDITDRGRSVQHNEMPAAGVPEVASSPTVCGKIYMCSCNHKPQRLFLTYRPCPSSSLY